jgi:hypothetical protein
MTRKSLIRLCERVAKFALIGFGVAIGMMFLVLAVANENDRLALPIVLCAAISLLVCGPVYICSLIARDIISLGYVRWQFSLRGMLTLMTLVALFFGSIGFFINYMRQ